MNVTQRRMERIMLGITLLHRLRNTSFRQKTKVTDVAAFCKKLKWEFAGKIARETGKWTTHVLHWVPAGKRGRGRPRPRWEDEIRKAVGENWKTIARDKEAWSNL